jgi:hypothetical protein
MDVIGQFHDQVALTLGKYPLPRYPLDSRLGGTQSLSGLYRE